MSSIKTNCIKCNASLIFRDGEKTKSCYICGTINDWKTARELAFFKQNVKDAQTRMRLYQEAG